MTSDDLRWPLMTSNRISLLEQRDPDRCTISKTLSCFIWGTSYWELNAFKGAKHVAILEVEAESRDCELCFPEFLPVVREVTDEQVTLDRFEFDPDCV